MPLRVRRRRLEVSRSRSVLRQRRVPRILIITPEVASLPVGMSPWDSHVTAKAGGMADVVAGIITALSQLGADVHVAIPNYRTLFYARSDGIGRHEAPPVPNGHGPATALTTV